MPKRPKPAVSKKPGASPALAALKRLADADEPDVAVLKRAGGDEVAEPDIPQLKRIFDDAARSEASGNSLKWLEVECPHCGEIFEVCVDAAQEGQELVQDCQSCAVPVTMAVEVEDGEVSVSAYS